jgi:hypothetical protein
MSESSLEIIYRKGAEAQSDMPIISRDPDIPRDIDWINAQLRTRDITATW